MPGRRRVRGRTGRHEMRALMGAWDRVAGEFAEIEGIWLNTAHQGPLPRRAVDRAHAAVARKASPARMTEEAFSEVPDRLRRTLARLIEGQAEEIVLGNSTSHGLHLIANGIDWSPGDEVITVRGDYPATVLPWRRLEARGVIRREVGRTTDGLIDLAELAALLGPRTRVVAVTWVDSFTGAADDVTAIGGMCRANGTACVVNGSQAVGARSVDVSRLGVDAVVACGYKWLCGPYGTGFAWLSPSLQDQLASQQAYWLANPAGSNLEHMRDHTIRDDLGVRGFDMFCTANFFNAEPWIAALELLLHLGPAEVEQHNQALVASLLDGLDPQRYIVRGPQEPAARSTLVVLGPRDEKPDTTHHRLASAGIATAVREGHIRLCPHLFNSPEHIDRALDVLHN